MARCNSLESAAGDLQMFSLGFVEYGLLAALSLIALGQMFATFS